MVTYSGMGYPIVASPKGYFPVINDVDLVKGDLLILLLTNPGERCLTGDTKIPLAKGIDCEIKDLENQEPFWVYSYCKNSNSIVPAKATARKTALNAKLVAVTLDNGEVVRCTHDHLWLLRDGNYCRADELTAGNSLMPFYRHLNTSGYERIYQPDLGDYRETHLRFVSGTRLSGIREVVHHKDLNKRNNNPDNLQWMTCQEHRELHSQINNAFINKINSDESFKKQWIEKIKIGLKKYYENHASKRKGFIVSQETCEKLSSVKKEFYASEKGQIAKENAREKTLKQFEDFGHPFLGKNHTEESKEKMKGKRPSITGDNNPSKRPEVREKLKLAWIERRKKKNHKVLCISELTDREDCYDLYVEKYHNFALSSGVFVHNCMMPQFGTPLKTLVFDQNDAFLADKARTMIINSITQWEPRIKIDAVNISAGINQSNRNFLNSNDDLSQANNVLAIQILFTYPGDIRSVQELVLQVPLQGVLASQ